MSTSTYETINAKDKPIAEDFVYVYSEIEDGGFRKVSKAMLKVLLGVATKLSELENDKAFITKTVSDLENYYSKSDTYSKDEIDNRISLIPRFDVQVVSSLPTTDISETTVYLVYSGDDSDNLYTEYINVNGLWEILGTQKIASVENAVLYTEQSLTEEQKTQARTNISAASSEEVRQLEEQITDLNGLEISETEPTNENTDLWINPSDDEEVNIYTAEEVDEKLSKAGSAEVPIFDLAEMGLSEIPADGSIVSVSVDTSEIINALEKGLIDVSYLANINLTFGTTETHATLPITSRLLMLKSYDFDENLVYMCVVPYSVRFPELDGLEINGKVCFSIYDGNIGARQVVEKNEIPTFDFVKMGLPAVPMIGDGVYIEVDTTELRNALSKGVVKGKFNVIYSGNILPYEFISTSCYVAYEDRYVSSAIVPSGDVLCIAHVFVETGKISARCDVITV